MGLRQWGKRARMIFADPPDDLGLKYNGFKDKFNENEYNDLLHSIINNATQYCEVLWLSFNSRHTFVVGAMINDFLRLNPNWEGKACQQVFTFGQHNHNDLGNNHRPLYRLMYQGAGLYPEQIRVPSWRQLNGDKRADPRGRVPGDVFDFPRVTGNSKQRRAFSPTQLHEGLYERCVRFCCKPGDTVVDLFAGSGTLGRVATRCEVNARMFEISQPVCEAIAADQQLARIDTVTWAGPINGSIIPGEAEERGVPECAVAAAADVACAGDSTASSAL